MTKEQMGQRRLAAIMFTDMVGFSAMAQRDEALAVDLLEEHRGLLRPQFDKYEGHEIKTIGDGFLVEFSSALAAVSCAIEIQATLARRNEVAPTGEQFHVRIGIHLGDVISRGDDIMGDGVNIAARVEPLAESGGVAITQQVFDQVYNKIPQPLVRIGKVELKNIQRPMDVYRIEAVSKMRTATEAGPAKSSLGEKPKDEPQQSIAVLPFVNMSSDKENEFLSDGISEDLLNALSGIEGLHVVARTSCFAFKGLSEDIRKIGEALGVHSVLEGSVRKADNKLRITAQLINVADGFRLWSQSFDREMQDVFAIQDDITRAIMTALKVRLSGSEERPLVKSQTASTEAYELYLKGRFYWNQRGIGLRKALHYFELALIEDPNYELALSGLADTYSLLSWYGYLPPGEVIPKAIAAATRALQLDPKLAEAHTSLGFCLLCQDCDWDGAQREFRRAIELNGRTVPAHYWLGWLHSCSGNHDEALRCCLQAVELEPFSPIARTFLGWIHYHAGDLGEAERQLIKVLELDARFVFGIWFLGRVYVAAGQRERALALLLKAEEISDGAAWTRCMLGHALARFGDRDAALKILAELMAIDHNPYIRAIGIGLVYLGLGDRDRALIWLDRGSNDRDVWALMLMVDPIYGELRNDARFGSLLSRMGLAQEATL